MKFSKSRTNLFTIKFLFVLVVPFSLKDEAKRAGAKWNAKLKSWYLDIKFSSLDSLNDFINCEDEYELDSYNIFNFELDSIVEHYTYNNFLTDDISTKLKNKFIYEQNIYQELKHIKQLEKQNRDDIEKDKMENKKCLWCDDKSKENEIFCEYCLKISEL
jgi:hypothetical protein